MRFAAFLLVLAVALGAFLVLRPSPSGSDGVSPDASATAAPEEPRAPVDLVRGETSPAARSQVPPAAPPAGAAKPATKSSVTPSAGNTAMPIVIEGPGAIAASALPEGDPELDKKYSGSTPFERRQAIVSIRNLYTESQNLDPRVGAALKSEIEWLERSLDG